MNRIYLDYAATTPMDKEVKKAMEPHFFMKFGNPNSLHYFGQQARKAVDEAREKIAKSIGAEFREVIFTGSATESNNIALRGITQNYAEIFRDSPRSVRVSQRPRLIISAVEHESVLETARDLSARGGSALGGEKEGVEVIYLPVNRQGVVDLKKLKESLNENTVLVSIMYANNEIGTIQPISKISEIIRDFRSASHVAFPLLHVDAVQAFQFLNCNVNDLGVDLMTLSAHKIYGPKGTGLLYIKQSDALKAISYKLKAIITGGGQEFSLRSGTENVAGIVGFAKAVELADKNRHKEALRIAKLKAYFLKELKKIKPDVQINGASSITNYQLPITNLPNILNIYFPNQKAEELLIRLDLNGVAASSGSACASFSAKPSYVLKAVGLSGDKLHSNLRFSMGKFTKKEDIDQAIKIIKIIFRK